MKIYLVGGAVRDQLLNIVPTEHDWVVVGARVEDMLALGYKPVGKDFPVFIHPESGDEYALARTERKFGKGYTGFVCHSSPDVTLEEDLLRRDLTINAIAMDVDGKIIDPYGGQKDLERKILRHVSDAFIEDPLRVLRTARFAARFSPLGFHIAEETLQLMQAIAESGELDSLVNERLWKETERALGESHAEVFFITLQQCNALKHIFPELEAHFPTHAKLLEKICAKLNDPALRLAYMLNILSETTINQLADRLRLPNHYRDACLIISRHRELLEKTQPENGEILFLIIENIDAFRRPQRLNWLCDVISSINNVSPLPAQLRKAMTIISSIDASSLSAKGFTGKALGDELRKVRIQHLRDMF
jgi:tRNA nucleotidyltransferase (CCA-adding enzyme)